MVLQLAPARSQIWRLSDEDGRVGIPASVLSGLLIYFLPPLDALISLC